MNNQPDYHVVSLSYSLQNNDEVAYDAPRPLDFETDEARFCLADAKLTCEMKMHFATETDARAAVESVLRAWEIDADLRRGKGELRFKFESAELIDRTPAPPGVGRTHISSTHSLLIATGTASVHVTRRTYPEPPYNFRVTPDVATLWNCYQGYIEGREPLLAMAYFCLTVLESLAGRRTTAAAQYKIEERVL